ncbi:SRPBCC family protein [Ancylobacter terrae]|uniref:SRPBCC family protein n=1 Tax=Ancylobacter sp. sgz301288 TaxID=3342077 RepID=UPI00385FABDD
MSVRRSLLLAGLFAVAATPALAIEVTRSVEVAAPPAKTWATIGAFCQIGSWHPALEKCDLSQKGGATIRTLHLKGGGTIVEEQTARDDKTMSYGYKILESPLPVADYMSTISVKPHGTGSTITWTGHFKAKGAPDAKAAEVITGIYDSGLASLRDAAK